MLNPALHPRWLLLWLCVLTCFVLWSGGALAASYAPNEIPNPRDGGFGNISNPDDLIDEGNAAQIQLLLSKLEADTGAQVAVVAVEDIHDPEDIFTFAHTLFERWGIGQKGRDNGLLVLMVRNQRVVRMQTGYGLEGTLPDLLVGRIQREHMAPAFRQGEYGAGLLAGLRVVDQVVRDPDAMQPWIPPSAHSDENWKDFKWIMAITVSLIGLFCFLFKWAFGHFVGSKSPGKHAPQALRYTRMGWLLAFVGAPLAILAMVNWLPVTQPSLFAMAAIYGYFILLGMRQLWRLQSYVRDRADKRRYFDLALLYQSQRRFWAWVAVAMPIPFLLVLPFIWTRYGYYRHHSRACGTCDQPMRLLSEDEEDVHLKAPRQTEERLGSKEHDVWCCTSCGALRTWSFNGAETRYEACPSCKAMAYEKQSDTILVRATTERAGKGERAYLCHHCGLEKTQPYSISRLPSSSGGGSSHSGSFSSSSSSGSWGGGRSGGGGASTSW